MKQLVTSLVSFTLLFLMSLHVHADSLETSIGSTFYRDSAEDEGLLVNFAYVDENTRYPIEYSIGFIEGSGNTNGPLAEDFGYAAIGIRHYWDHLFVGLGAAIVSETNDRISSELNFKTHVGYQYKSIVFKIEHLSNAGIKGENKGESFISIGYVKKL